MPLIRVRVLVNDDTVCTGLYDPGSSVSLIHEDLINDLKIELQQNKTLFKCITGTDFSGGRASIKLKIGKLTEPMNFHVVKRDHFNYDLLLGIDCIKKFRLAQDVNLDIQQVLPDRTIKIAKHNDSEKLNCLKGIVNHIERRDILERRNEFSHLPAADQAKLIELLNRHRAAFTNDKFDVTVTGFAEAEIRLKRDEVVALRPYKCTIPDGKEIESQVEQLLQAGLIEESTSCFSSPVTLADKGSEKRSRLCIDLRKLNELVVEESQPFPLIDDIIDGVSGCWYWTTIDINSAFWTIPLARRDRHKTAFVTKTGHYQWRVLPFGLKIASSIFQRILSSVLKRYRLTAFARNYIDDILVFSRTLEEHLRHLELVIKALSKEMFKLKFNKCKFAQLSVDYLGHTLSHNSVRPLIDRVEAIQNFPRPSNATAVRQFLGKLNYYHRYIEDCARKLAPLHKLLRANSKFEWTEECERAFSEMKAYLSSEPILATFNPERESFVFTDASQAGLGAVLKQVQDDGQLRPVAYFSMKLSETKQPRDALYLECLAIKQAVSAWHHYLYGTKFTVVSDHKPLQNFKLKVKPETRMGQLVLFLSQYDFRIVYRAGRFNQEADALSRNPVLEYFECDGPVRFVNFLTIEEIRSDQEALNAELTRRDRARIVRRDGLWFSRKHDNKLVISKSLGRRLIERVQDKCGHIGRSKIADEITPNYYFKGMYKEIDRFCGSDPIRIKNQSRQKRPIGKLAVLGPAERPFQIMSIDSVGGFAGGGSTKSYLHILVDHFTRYAWILTSRSQTATNFVHLMRPILRENKVETVLVDQYTGLNSNEFKTYLDRSGVSLVFTSVNCAQSNGINERLNQNLVNRIRCKVNEGRGRAWPVLAEEAVNQYNNTRHSVTRFTPKFLLLGIQSKTSPFEEDIDLESARRAALINSRVYSAKNLNRINRRRRELEISVGDQVYVENGARLNRRKLSEVRIGPYEVVEQLSPLIYRLNTGKRRRENNLFHKNKLIPVGRPEERGM